MKFDRKVGGHDYGISGLAEIKGGVVSGDVQGNVIVWNVWAYVKTEDIDCICFFSIFICFVTFYNSLINIIRYVYLYII